MDHLIAVFEAADARYAEMLAAHGGMPGHVAVPQRTAAASVVAIRRGSMPLADAQTYVDRFVAALDAYASELDTLNAGGWW